MANKNLKWKRIFPNPGDTNRYVDIASFSAGADFTIHVGKTLVHKPAVTGHENQYFVRLTTIGYNGSSKAPIPKPACVDIIPAHTFYTRKDENAHVICVKHILDWAGQNRKTDETADRIYNQLKEYL